MKTAIKIVIASIGTPFIMYGIDPEVNLLGILLSVVLGIITMFLLFIMFTDKLDWLIKN